MSFPIIIPCLKFAAYIWFYKPSNIPKRGIYTYTSSWGECHGNWLKKQEMGAQVLNYF